MRKHDVSKLTTALLMTLLSCTIGACDQAIQGVDLDAKSQEKMSGSDRGSIWSEQPEVLFRQGIFPCAIVESPRMKSRKPTSPRITRRKIRIPFSVEGAPLQTFRYVRTTPSGDRAVTIECIAPDIPYVHARLLGAFVSKGNSTGSQQGTKYSGSKATDLEYVWDEGLGMYVFNEVLVESSEITDDPFEKWLEDLDGNLFLEAWNEGESGSGGGSASSGTNLTGADFEADIVLFDPDCENPRNAGEAAYCRGWVPSSRHKDIMRDLINRIAQRGGVCAELGRKGLDLLGRNQIRAYNPSHRKESAYAGHDGSWIAIAYPWLEHSDAFVRIESPPGYVDLEMILVHELDHAVGNHFHTDVSGTKLPDSVNTPYTPNLFECAGIDW